MRRPLILTCFGIAALIFLGATHADAQNIAFNGDFETGAHTDGWTLKGGNTHTTIALFESTIGKKSLCLKRRPGTPSSNGGLEQQVHLLGGVTYNFSADIVAEETG